MTIGDYEIVEYTDFGDLYCFKLSSNKIPKKVNTLFDLHRNDTKPYACATVISKSFNDGNQTTEKHSLIYYDEESGNRRKIYLYKEGKIFRAGKKGTIIGTKVQIRDSWMTRVDHWLKRFVINEY